MNSTTEIYAGNSLNIFLLDVLIGMPNNEKKLLKENQLYGSPKKLKNK